MMRGRSTMCRDIIMDRSHKRLGALAAILLLGMSICFNGRALAASGGSFGEAFASKEAAVQALMQAMRGGDSAALLKILGPGSKPIVISGDAVADKAAKARISAAYDQMHRFITENDGRVFLYLGADNWPMPIPLVERKGKVRSHHIPDVNAANLRPIVEAQIHGATYVMTDEGGADMKVGGEFARHGFVNHGAGEYVRGEVHINTIEGYFSIFKRGIYGTYHHLSQKHLKR